MSRNCCNCFWHIFKHRSTSLVNFYCSGTLYFVTRSFEICLNFELQKRSFERIPLISIFLKINRYSAKRTPNIRIWAELIFERLPPNVWPLVSFALKFSSFSLVSWKNCHKLTMVCSPFETVVPILSLEIWGTYSYARNVFHLNFSTFSPPNVKIS